MEDFLLDVRKPGRYINHEWNAVRKDPAGAKLKFCLVFPDIYEIGMSHLGMKILYGLLNEEEDVFCDRVFSPWPDYSQELKTRKISLKSLEADLELKKFDLLGFSLQYEMGYTNILDILKLSDIPFKAIERTDADPVVIAGGVSIINPEPIADLFDAIVIGEAEEVILEITQVFRSYSSRDKILTALSDIEGVYVPVLYKGPEKIKKRFIRDFDKAYYPVKQIVPNISIIHDRVALEVMRGCPNSCRFCQARSSYYPVRTRKAENILKLAKAAIAQTGYEEVSLVSLSTSQHPEIIKLLKTMTEEFKNTGVNLSLPSLRIGDVLKDFPAILKTLKKAGLTFAVEAASERLRSIIGKKVDFNALENAALSAFQNGWQRIKLYFMIGLPGETEKDLGTIIETANQLSGLRKKVASKAAHVNVSVANFVPKSHTPFQWEEFTSPAVLKKRQEFIQSQKRPNKVKLKFHDIEISYLEAVFSRGDRKLSSVLIRAYELGAGFDSWGEHFKPAVWKQAFQDCGIDPDSYIVKRDNYDEALPWDHIDCGVKREYLVKESKIARKLID